MNHSETGVVNVAAPDAAESTLADRAARAYRSRAEEPDPLAVIDGAARQRLAAIIGVPRASVSAARSPQGGWRLIYQDSSMVLAVYADLTESSVDGSRFLRLRWLRPCSRCGQEIPADDIHTLACVGRELARGGSHSTPLAEVATEFHGVNCSSAAPEGHNVAFKHDKVLEYNT